MAGDDEADEAKGVVTDPIERLGIRRTPRRFDAERFAILFARLSLGAAFLSGIASRFGWRGAGVGYGDFDNFVAYTAQVNSFMPDPTIPFLAWAATAAELVLGIALVAGLWPRPTALASAALLLVFGGAMAISFGLKEPLDYSVFSAAAAALLLACVERGAAPGRTPIRRRFLERLLRWWTRRATQALVPIEPSGRPKAEAPGP